MLQSRQNIQEIATSGVLKKYFYHACGEAHEDVPDNFLMTLSRLDFTIHVFMIFCDQTNPSPKISSKVVNGTRIKPSMSCIGKF